MEERLPYDRKDKMKVIFIAGSYIADTWEEVEENIVKARDVAIRLWGKGWAVICPHMNSAHFDMLTSLPESTYLDGYRIILMRCNALYMMKDWEMSSGARKEHALAEKLGIPILYEDETTVNVTFVENNGSVTGTMRENKDAQDS